MHLEKISLRGFKSFAEKTELVFPLPKKGKGITVIVGPNGSGKSNIVDAIKWVLGEQSLKSLRGKKATDIIFHGSARKGRLGMAEVSLYLSNEDKAFPLPAAEIVLQRRIYQSGESEYLLNKRKAKWQDIQLLLAKANFGHKSFSVISQGTIDYLLQTTPKERKEFFDEAVGVKQYQLRRRQALLDLDKAEQNLQQVAIALNELRPRVNSLRRQAQRKEKEKEYQEELLNCQKKYYSSLWAKSKEQVVNEEKKVKEAEKKEKEISQKLEEKKKAFFLFRQEKGRAEKFDLLREQLQAYFQEKNRILKQLALLQSEEQVAYKKSGRADLAWLKEKKEELKAKEKQQRQRLDDLRIKQAKKKEKEAELAKKYQNCQKMLAEIEAELAKVARLPRLSQAEKEALKQDLMEIRSIFSRLPQASAKDRARLCSRGLALQEKIISQIKNFLGLDLAQRQERLFQKKEKIFQDKQEIWQELNACRQEISLGEEKKKIWEEEQEQLKREIKELEEEIKCLQGNFSLARQQKEKQKLAAEKEKELAALEEKIKQTQKELDAFNQKEQARQEKVFALQKEIQECQNELDEQKKELYQILLAKARLEERQENLKKEIKQELGEIDLPLGQPLSSEEESALEQKISKLKKHLLRLGGIEDEVLQEYQEAAERLNFLEGQEEDLQKAVYDLRKIIQDLDKAIKEKFEKSFSLINKEFNRYFQILFGGGKAKLVRQFSSPAAGEEGAVQTAPEAAIEILAAPQGKKLKDIYILSGGERSLVSLALVCAIISINPAPFVVLDEVDASLDEANSQRFAEILQKLSQRTQFIAITH